jgi:HAD superfamily hydrolase (TIGR01490 family)
MSLALFDLDNTLLAGDSDYLWGKFLADQGVVDADWYERENHRFYEEYKAGTLDIREFLAFSLEPLRRLAPDRLAALHQRFMAEVIRPLITPAARALLDFHRQRGEELLIITATNRFVTEPIARELGVPHLLASEPEMRNGRYTGQVAGTPCFREGKVERLRDWLRQTGHNLAHSPFYSDSHNDLPLLEMVPYPIAVDPDQTLQDHAAARDWPILSLRGDSIEVRQGRWPIEPGPTGT